jgi:hypothetical protein
MDCSGENSYVRRNFGPHRLAECQSSGGIRGETQSHFRDPRAQALEKMNIHLRLFLRRAAV